MSDVQNQQRGDQQAQEAAGQAQDAGLVTDQAGQVTDQAQDATGQVAGQAQDIAGQATDQAGQLVGQTQDAAGGLIGGGRGDGRSGEQDMDDYSYSDSDATTVENDKTPKGILGQLLNLDILPHRATRPAWSPATRRSTTDRKKPSKRRHKGSARRRPLRGAVSSEPVSAEKLTAVS